jgi:hypothetical protein
MINRFNGAAEYARAMASQPVTWSSVAKTGRGLMTTMQHTLTMLGLSALALMAVLYTRPDLARELSQFLAPEPVVVAQVKAPALSALMEAPATPVAPQTAAQMEAEQKALAASEKQQQWALPRRERCDRHAGLDRLPGSP